MFLGLLQLDRLQLTAVFCNRRRCEHHTSHVVFSHRITCTRMAQVWVRTHSITSMLHAHCGRCVWLLSLRRLHFPLLPHHLLSYRPVLPSARQLHLPGCGGQIPCALPPMRTLAPLPSTTLSLIPCFLSLCTTCHLHCEVQGQRLASLWICVPSKKRVVVVITVHGGKQFGGPAGAGTQWPQWHTLLFEGQVAVDMRVFCPQDVKKMLLKQGGMVCWKRRAATHMSVRSWRKEFGWSQLRLCCEERPTKPGQISTDMWRGSWSWKEDGCSNDCTPLAGQMKRSVGTATKKRGKTQTVPFVHHGEQGAKTSRGDWKWQGGITVHPLSENTRRKSHLLVIWSGTLTSSVHSVPKGFLSATDDTTVGGRADIVFQDRIQVRSLCHSDRRHSDSAGSGGTCGNLQGFLRGPVSIALFLSRLNLASLFFHGCDTCVQHVAR